MSRDHLVGWAGAAALNAQLHDGERRFRAVPLSAKEWALYLRVEQERMASPGYVGEPVAVEDFNGNHGKDDTRLVVIDNMRAPDGRVLPVYHSNYDNVKAAPEYRCTTCCDTGRTMSMVCYGGLPQERVDYCPDCHGTAADAPANAPANASIPWVRLSNYEKYEFSGREKDSNVWVLDGTRPTAAGWYLTVSVGAENLGDIALLQNTVRERGGRYERYWDGINWSASAGSLTVFNDVSCKRRQEIITEGAYTSKHIAWLPCMQSTPVR